jgi:type II secretory pathway component PulJ
MRPCGSGSITGFKVSSASFRLLEMLVILMLFSTIGNYCLSLLQKLTRESIDSIVHHSS